MGKQLTGKIKSFKDLKIWQKSIRLVEEISKMTMSLIKKLNTNN